MALTPAAADVFRCPACRSGFELTNGSRLACASCGFSPEVEGDVIDFVLEEDRSGERSHYDAFYEQADPVLPPGNLGTLAATWTGPDAPWEMRRVWDRLGDLRGRSVVLLGNGESFNELHMLTKHPQLLVYSDLSPVGLRELRRSLDRNYPENLVFAAIDALDLPLADESTDLLYGFAFTHHLPDLEPFFDEAMRVLRPGGRCVFMDNAYSPAWQRMKLTVLRPLMELSHRRHPRSPEDVRDTLAGGFREERLEQLVRHAGGDPWFERLGLVYYLWRRASVSLFPEVFRYFPRRDLITLGAIRADRFLARFGWARRNMIRLVWGFDKPQSHSAS